MEESPGVLANSAANAATSTAPAQAGSEDAELGAPVEIVRATAKLRLDFSLVQPLEREDLTAPGAPQKELARQLYEAQKKVSRGMNACMTALWLNDSQRLYEYMRANNGQIPKAKDWPMGNDKRAFGDKALNLYDIVNDTSPGLPGHIASLAARGAHQRWQQDRYSSLVRLERSRAYFGERNPIPLRAADTHIERQGNDYLINFFLRAGRGQRWLARIKPRDDYQKTVLANIASGIWKHGNLHIERDRRKRWFFRITYKRMAPRTSEGKVAAINRGIRVFLACATEDGERWLYDGNDIVAYLKQMQERRKQYQRDAKAAARAGRGRKRILRPIQHLSDKGGRWRATKCQTIARRLTRWLADRGVKKLLVEDLSNIRDGHIGNEYVEQLIQEWPFYQLEQRIRSCCEEVGIEVENLPPQFISQQCPQCGDVDEDNRDLKRWKLKCSQCSYSDHLDVAAAKNLIRRQKGLAPTPPAPQKRTKKTAKKKSTKKKR